MSIKIIASAGHAEYGNLYDSDIAEVIWEPLTNEATWAKLDAAGDDRDREIMAESLYAEANPSDAPPPDADLTWEVVVRLQGSRAELDAWLTWLLADLEVAPSGDDTTYDYWPSGVRLAREVAAALGRSDEVERAVAAALRGTDATLTELGLEA